MSDNITIKVRRSQLGRVRGPGSAKSGVEHWFVERLTSIALVPLTLWFIFAMVRHAGATQEAVVAWVSRPLNTVLLLALIVTTFKHMNMGIQVILEDYVHERRFMLPAMLANGAVCWLLGILAAVSVLKLALW